MTQVETRALSGPRILVVAAVVVAYGAWAVSAGMSLSRWGATDAGIIIDDVLFQAAFLGFPAVGGVLAVRRRHNPIGWLLLALGVKATLSWLTGSLVERQLSRGDVGAVLGASVSIANALTPVILLILAAFLLLFPDASLSRWQRIMLTVAGAMTAVTVVVRLFRPGPLDLGSEVDLANPLGVGAFELIRDITDPLGTAVGVVVLVSFAVVVRRFVRADGVRRLQFKWVIVALGVAVALQFVTQFLPEDDTAVTIEDFASVIAIDIGLLGLCAAIFVAVTRHRLFELDRLISRTLAWSIVTATVVGIYAMAVLTLGAVVRAAGVDGGSDLIVAASTLLAAVSVRPLLRRTRRAVDRRFDRAYFDAQGAVVAMSARLREEVQVTTVVEDLTATASSTLQPRSAWVWLVTERPG